MEQKMKVLVTERTTKDGRKFNTYCTFSKNGRRTELKFRKTVTNLPVKDCYIVVNPDAVTLDTSKEYPVTWVAEVLAIEDIAAVNAENNRAKVSDYFGW